MSTDSNYSDYGFEYVVSFDEEELFVVIPEDNTSGVLELTEQDLRDMLAVLMDKKG